MAVVRVGYTSDTQAVGAGVGLTKKRLACSCSCCCKSVSRLDFILTLVFHGIKATKMTAVKWICHDEFWRHWVLEKSILDFRTQQIRVLK